jgi:hypothetical protein
MVMQIDEKKLKALMKESIREVMKAELMQFRAFVLSEVSKKEQKDIEKRYGKPSRKTYKEYEIET